MSGKQPRRGDVYWVDFNPARGSEQAGRRPALIVSADPLNTAGPVVVVAAITRTVPKRSYPQTVVLPAGLPVEGTVLCSQLMTVAKDRLLDRKCHLSADVMAQVDDGLRASLAL